MNIKPFLFMLLLCFFLAIFFVFIFSLNGCATTRIGVPSSVRLNNDIFKVTMRGKERITKENLENQLLYECARITKENGYNYFVILNTNSEKLEEHNNNNNANSPIIIASGNGRADSFLKGTISGQRMTSNIKRYPTYVDTFIIKLLKHKGNYKKVLNANDILNS